jgi:hypothetical protein
MHIFNSEGTFAWFSSGPLNISEKLNNYTSKGVFRYVSNLPTKANISLGGNDHRVQVQICRKPGRLFLFFLSWNPSLPLNIGYDEYFS